ncbi:MAG TPA: hypothetical protein VME17_04810 [Bryobacteraceae bacterium]|nr:hypothetical protein [Bryobacteraceae bacterium]
MTQGSAPGASQQKNQVPEDSVRQELNRVLASHEFHTSKRSQDFMRYVVEHTLAGRAEMLKERTIGIDVFGRSTSYEPSDDATVRVKAGEVRKRLGLYYAGQGATDPVRIELPAGTYVPEFRWTEGPVGPPAPEIPAQLPTPAQMPRKNRSKWILAAAAVALVAISGAGWWLVRGRSSATALDEFWLPVLKGTAPVSLCAAYVPVYGLNRDAGDPTRPEDFVLLTDQFVGGGDLLATARLSAMLTRLQHPYTLRIGNDVSFGDLRSAPAILVGYSYTRWKEISKDMRYFIEVSKTRVGITDNGNPTAWTIAALPADRRTNEDYAIVSRVFHPDTHAMLVEIAGITQYGTDAAAELVTTSDLLADAVRGAPADWQKKNMQLVLHVKVISGTPSSPKVVGAYYW